MFPNVSRGLWSYFGRMQRFVSNPMVEVKRAIPLSTDLRMEASIVVAQCRAITRGTGFTRDLVDSVVSKATRVAPVLSAADLATVINALTKSRVTSLHEELFPYVSSELGRFSARELGHILSSYCKSGVCTKNERIRTCMISIINQRMTEFKSATELALLSTAAGRLRLSDVSVIKRLLVHINRCVSRDLFTVRDVSVICEGLMGIPEVRAADSVGLFARLYTLAMQTIDRATLQELARLVEAFPELRTIASRGAEDPQSLSVGLFAFGRLCERGVDVSDVLEALKRKFVANIAAMDGGTVAEMLQSFLRWKIRVSTSELQKIQEYYRPRTSSEHLMLVNLAVTNAASSELIESFLTNLLACDDLEKLETVELVKLLDLRASSQVVRAVESMLILRHAQIREISAYRCVVLKALTKSGYREDDDLVLLFH